MIPWDKIKNHWRNQFDQTEIYTNEDEHIIVFKDNNTSIIIGYLHYNSCFWMSSSDVLNFIEFLKKIGNENYNSFKIYLLCNCNLSKITKPNEILSLPKDVDYYYVNYNWFYETIEFKLEDTVKSAKNSYDWQEIKKPWYHKKGIPVFEDSRFDDWDKWRERGYEREWYDWNEDERFDQFYFQMITANIDWYIDSRLLGFYLVWKWE
jgi:hypothetical protein